MGYDILIRGGTVIDGTGNPGYRADVAVKDGVIARILTATSRAEGTGGAGSPPADVEQAVLVLDATGKVVCPGFIDTHTHSDLVILADPRCEAKLRQGVTTEILGQDGLSVAPLSDRNVDFIRKRVAGLLGTYPVDWSWRSMADYLDRLERNGSGTNLMMLTPHGTVRTMVMGFVDRTPDAVELRQLAAAVEACMEQGAVGFSMGLIYPPCNWASEEEIVACLRAAARHGGVFVVHMRNESDLLLDSIREVLSLAEKADIPLHISHLKAAGRRMWGKAAEGLALLDEARARGIEVTFDQYPYVAGSTMLDAVIPPWAHEGGTDRLLERLRDPAARARIKENYREPSTQWENWADSLGWENIVVTAVKTEKNRPLEGKSIAQIAELLGKGPADAVFDLLVEEEDAVTMANFYGSEDDVRLIMQHPLMMACSDGILGGKPHPRVYGTFPRILGRYARDEKLFPLQDAVRRMTSAAAARFRIPDRGLVKEGFRADLVVFDPASVIDTATFADPIRFPEGIEHVLVHGRLAVQNGKLTGALAGHVLRHHA